MKRQRGLQTQALLSKPELSLLENKARVENTGITLPEVTGHTFPPHIYRSAMQTTDKLPTVIHFHGGY
jgi:acetyl esterase/lipase